jgi:putative endonuclease
MELYGKTRKDIGNLGENVAAEYLRRNGFQIIDRNVSRKTGEIDIIAQKLETLHFVEVKSLVCKEFPTLQARGDFYSPSENLHLYKISKVARTSEWYVVDVGWEGDYQIEAVLVWLREHDGLAHVRYLPQIL